MPMFAFCDETQIIETIVKPIVIDMMYFHPVWGLGDKSVHSDQVVFAVYPFAKSGVAVIRR